MLAKPVAQRRAFRCRVFTHTALATAFRNSLADVERLLELAAKISCGDWRVHGQTANVVDDIDPRAHKVRRFGKWLHLGPENGAYDALGEMRLFKRVVRSCRHSVPSRFLVVKGIIESAEGNVESASGGSPVLPCIDVFQRSDHGRCDGLAQSHRHCISELTHGF